MATGVAAGGAVLGYITKEMSDLVITPGELLMIEGDTGTYDMYVVVEGIFEIRP